MLPRMKKLALALLASASLVTPALACPDMDHSAPKTAEKSKDQKGTEPAKKDDAKAKDATNKDQKPADTAKTKEGEKKPDKVSAK